MTHEAYIVGGKRIPFTRSFTAYKNFSAAQLMTAAIQDLVLSYGLKGKKLDEVVLGAVVKHTSDFNLARECVLDSGLCPSTPAMDLQRACGTGLSSIGVIANKIALGQAQVGIGGGCDTNSDAPVVLNRKASRSIVQLSQARNWKDRLKILQSLRPQDIIPIAPAVKEPRTKKSMGDHCELMAQEWKITRNAQDLFAFESHQKAAKAYAEGIYDDMISSFNGVLRDTILRPETSVDKLGKLRPAFDRTEKGTLTAGNSSSLTDGASAVLLASESYAKENDLPVLAKFVDIQSSAVDFVAGDGLLMAPTLAVSELLKRNNMSLQDFAFYEIHEAFAAQVLCTLEAWKSEDYCKNKLGRSEALGEIDLSKLNIKGSSLALGHPFAATGGRVVATLSKILSTHGKKGDRGLISICTAGGMGVAAILEAV